MSYTQNVFAEARKIISSNASSLIRNLLPYGRQEGDEWVTLNPTRNDHSLGSFKIRLSTGEWFDFATNEGGDFITLYASVKCISRYEAACQIANITPRQRKSTDNHTQKTKNQTQKPSIEKPVHELVHEEQSNHVQSEPIAEPATLPTSNSTLDEAEEATQPALKELEPVELQYTPEELADIEESLTSDEQELQTEKSEVYTENEQADAVMLECPDITAQDIKSWNKKFGCEPTHYYRYTNAQNITVGYVVRWDFIINGKNTKEVRPFVFDYMKKCWTKGCPAEARPLYNLTELLARPDAPVLVVEGEKAVEAAKILFPDYVVVTSSLGASGYKKSDWSVLKDRAVIFSPDNDGAGTDYAKGIVKIICEKPIDVTSIEILKPTTLGNYIVEDSRIVRRDGDIPVGYDLANAAMEGWTAELIQQAMNDDRFKPFFADVDSPKIIPPETYTDDKEGEEIELGDQTFLLTKTKLLYLLSKKPDTSELETIVRQSWLPLCGHIKVTRNVEDANKDFGLTLDIVTSRRETVEIFIKKEELNSDKAVIDVLLRKGLEIENVKNKQHLNYIYDYINKSKPATQATGVDQVGWHGDCYVLPYADNKRNTYVIDNGQENSSSDYVLQSNSSSSRELTRKGTLKSWQENVGKYCKGNSRLIIAVCASLASTLFSRLNEDGCFFHFAGASSTGKTTTLYVAGSIWGIIKPSAFHTTHNAYEHLGKSSNDGLILLDELNQADSDAFSQIVYMGGNGSGKARMKRDCSAQAIAKFTNVALSTGEIGMDAKLGEKNKTATAGQGVRFIEILADAGAGLGIFENIYDFAGGASAFANNLKKMSEENCGVVIDEWMTFLVKNYDAVMEEIRINKKELINIFVKQGADGQIYRVAGKFATIAIVGEIAIRVKILPFNEGDAVNAVKKIFNGWLEQRGGTGCLEMQNVKKRLVSFLQEKINSRFLNAHDTNHDKNIQNVAGYIKYANKRIEDEEITGDIIEEFWFEQKVFQTEIVQSPNYKVFIKQLVADGFISLDKSGYPTQKRRPSKQDARRFYVIPASVLSVG
jgi:putative DNA primase/helicase